MTGSPSTIFTHAPRPRTATETDLRVDRPALLEDVANEAAAQRAGHVSPSAPSPFAPLLAMQRLAGNAATAAFVQKSSPSRLAVQRKADCGEGCGCASCGGEAAAQVILPAVQREDKVDPPPGDGSTDDTLGTTATSTAGTFKDDIQSSDSTVTVAGTNSADWNANVQSKLGGDGGEVSVKGGTLTPTLDNTGKINGLTVPWTITKTVPAVDTSGFTDAGEKAAAQALAAQLVKHESSHKDNEVKARTGFAATMKGKAESALDKALKALECHIGKTQRALDNAEGKAKVTPTNTIALSGVDHPDYEAPCNKATGTASP